MIKKDEDQIILEKAFGKEGTRDRAVIERALRIIRIRLRKRFLESYE